MARTSNSGFASPLPAPAARERIAHRYEIQEEIARGGMGVVYRVLDRSTGAERALKRMQLTAGTRAELYLTAFQREYSVLASLDHPRIIRVFEYGVDQAGPFYTMELLRGRDLKQVVPLPWTDVCRYLRDLATSLSLLHARRLLHRDLSPGNVKLDGAGHCKLLDFGALSDFGRAGWLIGTPPMISPEVLRGEPIDQRADLYALGALAYWTLTGRNAFPARRIEDLPECWETPPLAPSSYAPEIPAALDKLVLSLLSLDALARPSSAAEVIARLTIIGQLAPEDETERKQLAQSFLIVPPFVGRSEELTLLQGHLARSIERQGSAVRVEALPGTGSTRLLEEVGLRAQILGATVLRVDASMHPNHQGTIRALALRLLDALPDLARAHAKLHSSALLALGRELETRLNVAPSRPPVNLTHGPVSGATGELDDWIIAVSQHQPLLIEVDNVEYCDDFTLGLLLAMAKRARSDALFILVVDGLGRARAPAKGLALLRESCESMTLSNLASAETLALTRSLFGDAPNVDRFAEWLHGCTAGSPLHCVEITRQLVAQQVIQHDAGVWVLPAGRPRVELPEALEDMLAARLSSLGEGALALARCLSLQRTEPTLALCELLVMDSVAGAGTTRSSEDVRGLLVELAQHDVLLCDQNGYRFSTMALREALRSEMKEQVRDQSHLQLGRAFTQLAAESDLTLRIEAGWHFIQGGDELRGADIIASVMSRGFAMRALSANNYPIGPASEAALKIYKRHRRGRYERAPLLAALAQAGYYEDFSWSERYGDEALEVMEDIAGMRLAARLRPLVGRYLALPLALMVAALRFMMTPKRERKYSLMELLHQMFSTVTALVGAASISLDADRADAITQVLEPFSFLPARTAPRGILAFCKGLSQIGREHQAVAFETFDTLVKRFEDRSWYRELPEDGRLFYITGAHFARAAFAIFRAHGQAALESAGELDCSGLKMYAMIASQIRFLYYANRGELAAAVHHRELVEVHAAHVGSAWQVELWEAAALLPLYLSVGDMVALTRIARSFDELTRVAPSLHFYRRLSELALHFTRVEKLEEMVATALTELERRTPRSFIGWSTVVGAIAGAYNLMGRHSEARALCERALTTMNEADREYVSLFLQVDLQAAIADAGLGQVDAAMERLDGLLERYRPSEHSLTLGLLHEARAQIAHRAGRKREYLASLTETNRYFRRTGTPMLLAKCEALGELQNDRRTTPQRPVALGELPLSEVNTDVLDLPETP
ncbi:MAG: serine/threonine protein kinase [Myxococcaceae bacterium]|nr:serine/threonine protein kinase [Myxococcaceae bacterium]